MKRFEAFFLFLTIFLLLLSAGCIQTVQNPAPVSPIPTSSQVTNPAVTNAPSAVITSANGVLRVHYIDVGQGDSILIESPDGKNMLIDGGEVDSGVLPYLKSKNVTRLDLVVATHPHADHIGGVVQVLKTIPVAKVVTNGQPTTTKTYENFLDAIASAKAEYVEVKRGDSLRLGDLNFAVLNPASIKGNDLNDNSLVLRLLYSKMSFLFTGDAQAQAESNMSVSSFSPVQANILKVGHHGSRTSSRPAFLALVKPEIAIYSAGRNNSYGHPHPETIAALAAVGAKIYGTDVNGTIVVTTDGISYKVSQATGQPRGPPGVQPTFNPISAPALAQVGTPTPALVPQSQALSLEVISVTSPIAPGGNATLLAKTVPGSSCSITVYYKSGPSTASGLKPKPADATGSVSWTWKVGTNTTPGNWRISVTASKDGESVTKDTIFTVRK